MTPVGLKKNEVTCLGEMPNDNDSCYSSRNDEKRVPRSSRGSKVNLRTRTGSDVIKHGGRRSRVLGRETADEGMRGIAGSEKNKMVCLKK